VPVKNKQNISRKINLLNLHRFLYESERFIVSGDSFVVKFSTKFIKHYRSQDLGKILLFIEITMLPGQKYLKPLDDKFTEITLAERNKYAENVAKLKGTNTFVEQRAGLSHTFIFRILNFKLKF
jgi:hypothetical protein